MHASILKVNIIQKSEKIVYTLVYGKVLTCYGSGPWLTCNSHFAFYKGLVLDQQQGCYNMIVATVVMKF